MKKENLRLLSMVLAIFMALGMLPVNTWANELETTFEKDILESESSLTESDIQQFMVEPQVVAQTTTGSSFKFTFSGGKLTGITNSDGSAVSGEIVIPSHIDGVEVKTLGNGLFNENANITKVIIPNTVESIEDGKSDVKGITGTFRNTANLKNVEFEDGSKLTTIGSFAFQASGIERINWPIGLKKFGQYAFEKTQLSGELVLPEGLEEIGGYAFKGCAKFTSVMLPSTLKTGASQWFHSCTGIESVIIKGGNNLTLPSNSFTGCTNLRSVEIGEGIVNIGSNSFQNCSSLINIKLPSTLKTIQANAFASCVTLNEIKLPIGLETIGNDVFKGCTSLTKVIKSYNSKGGSIKTLGKNVFPEGKKVTLYLDINEAAAISYAESFDNIEIKPIDAYTNSAPVRTASERAGKATPAGDNDRPAALNYKADMSSWFNDEDGDTLIYEIISAIDSDNVDVRDDISISNVTLTYIPKIEQGNKTVTIILKSYDGVAYSDKVTLTIEVSPKPANSSDDFTIDIDGKLLKYYGSGGDVEIPEIINGVTVKELSNNIFANNTEITSVKLPNTVTAIGSGAFSGCTNLYGIDLPDGLSSIGGSAFMGSGLIAVNLPTGITYLDSYVFADCVNFTSIGLHEGIKNVGRNCFSGTALTEILLPNSITSIGRNAFENCVNLKNIFIPAGVTKLDTDTFKGCISLESVVLPNGFKEIAATVFQNCSSLITIEIPESVTSILRGIFDGCEALERVIIKSENVNINNQAFDNTNNITIYAPEGSTANTFAENKNIRFIPISIGMQISVQDETGLVFFGERITAKYGRASEYSLIYPDSIDFADITVLDALIAAHEEEYGAEFNLGNQLIIGNDGKITKAFSKNVTNFGFSINGVKGTASLAETKISQGDSLHFFSGNEMRYVRITQDNEPVSSVVMILNRDYTLRVISENGTSLNNAGIYVINAAAQNIDDVFADTPIGTTDVNGEVTVKFSNAGKYILAVKSESGNIIYSFLIVNAYPADNRIGSIAAKGEPSFDISSPLKSGYYAGEFIKSGARKDLNFHRDYSTYDLYINPTTKKVMFTIKEYDETSKNSLKLTVRVNGSELKDYKDVGADKWVDIPVQITDNSTVVEFNMTYSDTVTNKSYTNKYKINIIKSALNSVGNIEGSGTEEDPYLIKDASNLEEMRDLVNGGNSFKGEYFKVTSDLTLPNGWIPIGNHLDENVDLNSLVSLGKGMQPFSGVFDGGGYTITVPHGEKALFGFVREATVRNLNIYGAEIAGYGLVNYYCIDYGPNGLSANSAPDYTIVIDNVTLKSGSRTLKAGFIGGNASGSNTVIIRNSTIEKDVVIGYNKSEKNIGSFAGSFNGRVENSISYADVYGVDNVGGLIGVKGQSMGFCSISNSTFIGNVIASGNYAGGIIGSGYADPTAPNSPGVSISNSYVAGSVKGSNYVGGLLGGEGGITQCWDNGIGYIQNNHFFGTVSATRGSYVGGIIGYMHSLNKYNVITNNFYLDTCGSEHGIGYVKYIDTSFQNPTANNLVERYFNTAESTPSITGVTKFNHHREDDPMGVDAEKLAKAVTGVQMKDGTVVEYLNNGINSYKNWSKGDNYPVFSKVAIASEIILSGDFKTEYIVGESFSAEGMIIKVVYSDGTEKIVSHEEVSFSGFGSSAKGFITIIVKYGSAETSYTVRVRDNGGVGTTKYYITLSIDKKNIGKGYVISPTKIEITPGETVWDVLKRELDKRGIEYKVSFNPRYNSVYIESIEGDGEMDHGKLSGWMYNVNGWYPDYGASLYELEDGDVVQWRYTTNLGVDLGEDNSKWGGTDIRNGDASGIDGKTIDVKAETRVVNNEATSKVIDKQIKDALAEAEKVEDVSSITIKSETETSVTKSTVVVPKSSVTEISGARLGLVIETPVGNITIPEKALAEIARQSQGSTVEIVIEKMADAKLTEEQKFAVEGGTVYNISIISGNKKISSFNGQKIIVFLPYELKEGQSKENVTVWYMNDKGDLEKISSTYNEKTGLAAFTTDHLSYYVVGYENKISFVDVTENDWFYKYVMYAVEKGWFSGMEENAFGPNMPMTRSMLVTVLYRMEGSPAVTTVNTFTDVDGGQWYTDAVIWANAGGIVTGYGEGKFGTNDPVTREQMAAIIYRYAQMKEYDVTKTTELTAYTDAASVSTWAEPAIKWAVSQGLITGTSGVTLSPAGMATRAQVAAILQRYIENVR